MEYRALATLVRESAATPPNDDAVRTRLAARAAELGLSSEAVRQIQQLWTRQGWVSPSVLQADASRSRIWN